MRNRLEIRQEELKATFDKVIPNIVTLVKGQVDGLLRSWERESIAAIVVVGGFGSCRYLQKCLKESSKLEGLSVVVSPNPYELRSPIISGSNRSEERRVGK